MKILFLCIAVFVSLSAVLVEQAPAVGPGGGARGPATGRAAAARSAPAAQRSGKLSNTQNLSEHLGINSDQVRTNASQAISQASAQWGSGPQPFSPSWYAQHPQAWQYAHPHADAFVAASATAVAAWLAVPVVAATSGGATTTTIIQESPSDETPTGKPAESVGNESVIDGTVDSHQWMSLGAFSLSSPGQAQSTRMVQLAVAHDGTIRGSYYDLISDAAQELQGSVNKASQRVFWSVGAKSGITFEATLQTLTGREGSLTVRFPNGTEENWKIRQVRN